jgi:hypothetical protein
MNVDPLNWSGMPVENPKLPYFRLVFNKSGARIGQPHSNQDLGVAFARYDPAINMLGQWGKVMMIFTHQTFGEYVGSPFVWVNMTPALWGQWVEGMAQHAREIASHYRGKVTWYQIGNENDKAGEASVYIPPQVYGELFRRCADAIRQADPKAEVITAGMVSGVALGSQYLRDSGIIPVADGVAFHAYGQDTTINPLFGQHGKIADFIWEARALGKTIYITEWGALDHEKRGTPIAEVAAYAKRFLTACQGKVEMASYFAWGSQHNGYPVSPSPGNVRTALLTELQNAPQSGENTMPINGTVKQTKVIGNIPNGLNRRLFPDISAAAEARALQNGDVVELFTDSSAVADDYDWQRIMFEGRSSWIAVKGGSINVVFTDPEPPVSETTRAQIRASLVEMRDEINALLAVLDNP